MTTPTFTQLVDHLRKQVDQYSPLDRMRLLADMERLREHALAAAPEATRPQVEEWCATVRAALDAALD